MFLIAQNRIRDVRDRIQKIRRVFQASPRRLCLPRAKYLAARLQKALSCDRGAEGCDSRNRLVYGRTRTLDYRRNLDRSIGFVGGGLVALDVSLLPPGTGRDRRDDLHDAFDLSGFCTFPPAVVAPLAPNPRHPAANERTDYKPRRAPGYPSRLPGANFTYPTKNSQGRRSRSDDSGSWCDDLASDRYV